MEEDVKCLPQLVEIQQKIPAGVGADCTGTYRIETPLLISTWEPDSVTVSVTGIASRCSGTTAVPDGSAVDVTFSGTGGGTPCSTPYLHDVSSSVTCTNPLLSGPSSFVGCGSTGLPLEVILNPGGSPGVQITTTSGINATGCYNGSPCSSVVAFTGYGMSNIRKANPADPDCEDIITVRYEGCSKRPPNTYGEGNPPPGGGTPGGGGSPGGSPPPSGQSPSPPKSPPSNGGSPPPSGGSPGGASPPPPAPLSTSSPPLFSAGTAQSSGDSITYPGNIVLTPQPEPEFPTLIVILPGSEPEQIPWNGYGVYPGSEVPGDVVVGTTYPALYVSPMMAQRVFHNWKVLKHALLQFDNREGLNIQTSLTTTDTGQLGKALQRFNVNVGIIYNDELSDQVIQELYRYDAGLWSSALHTKHYSPKQLEGIVSFKEPLQGTSYSYQIAVYSSDAATWRLVGWQIEGKSKGKRRGHGRD